MIKLSKRTDSFLLDIKHKLLYYSLRDGLYQLMDKEDCVGQKILSGHNARFKLSDSLRYLAAVTDDNEFVVFFHIRRRKNKTNLEISFAC